MTGFENYNDNSLFTELAKSDEQAYTKIFHLYTPRLYPYILKITKDEHLAKELLQETFLRLWIKREDLKDIRHPDSWLFRIAANICLSHLRSQAIRFQLQDKVFDKMRPGDYPVMERTESRDMELMIHKAIEALPPKRKEVYLLSREQELSYQQIADQLGISINTVKNQLGLATKSIQEYLHTQTGLSMAVLLFLLSY